jgi:hypothetical protein
MHWCGQSASVETDFRHQREPIDPEAAENALKAFNMDVSISAPEAYVPEFDGLMEATSQIWT